MGKRLDAAVLVGWDVLANLQLAGTCEDPGSCFWVGQLEGILIELLDAMREEDQGCPRK